MRGILLVGLAGVLLSARAAAQPTDSAAAADADGGEAARTPGVSASSSGGAVPPSPPPTMAGFERPAMTAEDRRAETSGRSYGLHIVGIDAASIVAGAATGRGEVFVAGWLLGAPLVHLAHGNPGRALGSLALHAGLPLAGALVGFAAESCGPTDGAFCGLGGAIIGTGLGMIAATSIDAAALAQDTDVPSQPAVARFIPQLQVGAGRVTVGVIGRL
jgi:hypothetical protein